MNRLYCLFFFNETATTEIYTLSLHDALPIFRRPTARVGQSGSPPRCSVQGAPAPLRRTTARVGQSGSPPRSEEHTSELQSRQYLVCRLLLEKKKKYIHYTILDQSMTRQP